MNQIRFDGKIIKDPILVPTAQGGHLCKFVVQSFERGVGRQNVFFKVVTLGKLAQQCASNLKRGMWVYVEGKIHQYTIQNDEGIKENRFEVMSFLVYPIQKMRRDSFSSTNTQDVFVGSDSPKGHTDVAFFLDDDDDPAFDFSEDGD